MKKILLGAMIASVALAASATEVPSANVVGYAKIDIKEGFNLIGSQFLNVGGTVKDVNDFIVATDLGGLKENWEFTTTMRVWTGTGYRTYGWMDAEDGTNNEMPEWDSTWLLNNMSDVATEDMNLGMGVWIKADAPATITVAGEVATGDTYTIDVNEGFNLVANPFPCEISVQNIKTDLEGLNENWEFTTTMRVWTGTGYRTYGWMDAEDGTNNEMPEWDSSWLLNNMSDLSDAILKVGEAIWIVAPSAGTVTFAK